MSLPSANKILTLLDNCEGFVTREKYLPKLQLILRLLKDVLEEIHFLPNNVKESNRLKLCASQLSKTLPTLISIANDRVKCSKKEIIRHLLEKVHWCLNEVLTLAKCEDSTNSVDPSGVFVKSMDQAISLVHSNKFKESSYKGLIDDLLCQALTIAKLSVCPDYTEISSACKNVLTSMSKIVEGDGLPEDLVKDQFLSSLECLERKVNTAVLKLVLHSMSQPWAPVKVIVMKCAEPLGPPSRTMSDLEELVTVLDLHCDRIHLIGHFAIACSENKKAILDVQSCLASLEFSESALVPALTQFYLDNTNLDKREFLKFVTESWQKELIAFNSHLDGIIDSLAFAEVVTEDLSELFEKIKETVMDKQNGQALMEIFMQRCQKLAHHLHLAPDSKIQKDARIVETLKEFQSGLKSCKTMTGQKPNPFSIPPLLCQIEKLLNIVRNIVECLNQIYMPESNSNFSIGSSSFENSVTDLSLDISGSSKTDSTTLHGRSWLKRKFLKDTKDGGKNENEDGTSPLKPYWNRASTLRTTFYGKTPTRSIKSSTTHFELSDVLENLTGVEVFSNSVTTCIEAEESEKENELTHCEKILAKEQREEFTPQSSKNTLSGFNLDSILTLNSDVSKANTFERNNDLQYVEKKIKFLQFGPQS